MKRSIVTLLVLSALMLATAQETRVSVGMLRLVSNAPIFIGLERGYFAEEGLNVVPEYFASAAPIATALASGAIDVGATGITGGLFNTIAGGLGARIVFDKGRVAPGFQTSAFLVANDFAGEITSIESLRGRSVGVTQIGSTFHYMLGVLLEQNGMTLDDVNVVPLNTLGSLQEALRGGRVDTAILPQPAAGTILSEGGASLLEWVDEAMDYQVAAVFYSRTFILNSAAAEAFARAYVRSVREYHDACIAEGADNEACTVILEIIARDTETPIDVVREGLYPMDAGGALGLESIADQLEWYFAQGFLTDPLTVADVVDTSYQEALEP